MSNKYTVGVFGSAGGEEEILAATEKARVVGRKLAENHCIVVTGACMGLPYEAAAEAHKNGGEIWGYSPCLDLDGQKLYTPDDDITIYNKIFYVTPDFLFAKDILVTKKYRNVLSTATCDAGILIAGRWGTLNEFTNLMDIGKVIGVLTGTGG